MKILITGGAGFIGSALVRYLIANSEAQILNIDKLTKVVHPYALASVSASPRYRFQRVDICDAETLARVFAEFRPQAVMHLAAETHVDRSLKHAEAFMRSNYMGTYELLEATRTYWQALSAAEQVQFRFLHVSTDEVYGDLPHPDVDPQALDLRFSEEAPLKPSSPYSASKAASDHLVQAWHRSYGLPTIITRCTNNYGPYQFAEKLIPHVVQEAIAGRPIPIYGNGQQMRDWLYVDDHVRALYLLLLNGKVGEIYNIGAHNEQRNLEVVQRICEHLDTLVPRADGQSYAAAISHVADRPGHDLRYAVDCTKLHATIQWQPEHHFETALASTVAWCVRDRDAAAKYRA